MKKYSLYLILFFLFSCSGSDDLFDLGNADDLFDLAVDPPSRQTIDTSIVGVNNFFVDPEFGTIAQQHNDIRNNLGLRFIRVLFAWTDPVQPTPDSAPNYSFYDDILNNTPAGVDILVVLDSTPAWMADPANWDNGNPRATWINRWLTPTAQRYGGDGRIIGFEVWNEPDLATIPSNMVLELNDPNNYFELLSLGSNSLRVNAPGKLILNAATISIQQNFPSALNYNVALRDLGALDLVDIWNVHYYSENFENVVLSNGVGPFLRSLGKPIWVTESGEQGPNNQLAYAETVWPFLREEIPQIERIYQFQYGEPGPIQSNFGLRTTNPSAPVSDLYIHLRDRNS